MGNLVSYKSITSTIDPPPHGSKGHHDVELVAVRPVLEQPIRPFPSPFPTDLYRHFCSVLHSSNDISTLLSFQRTSRTAYKVATPFIYRHVKLLTHEDWTSAFTSVWTLTVASSQPISRKHYEQAPLLDTISFNRNLNALKHTTSLTVRFPPTPETTQLVMDMMGVLEYLLPEGYLEPNDNAMKPEAPAALLPNLRDLHVLMDEDMLVNNDSPMDVEARMRFADFLGNHLILSFSRLWARPLYPDYNPTIGPASLGFGFAFPPSDIDHVILHGLQVDSLPMAVVYGAHNTLLLSDCQVEDTEEGLLDNIRPVLKVNMRARCLIRSTDWTVMGSLRERTDLEAEEERVRDLWTRWKRMIEELWKDNIQDETWRLRNPEYLAYKESDGGKTGEEVKERFKLVSTLVYVPWRDSMACEICAGI